MYSSLVLRNVWISRIGQKIGGRTMETSLRFSGDQKHLILHAKEKIQIENSFFLQVDGRLNTNTGAAGGTAQFKRRFHPEIFSNLDVGVKYDLELREFTYGLQGRKTWFIKDDGLVSMDAKGGYYHNPESQEGKPNGALELTYKMFNITKEQDLKLKLGFDLFEKKPYVQVRENNWTLDADVNGRWGVKYYL